ncbi:MAG: translation-associated GTPase [miscellaneous Crenarchaeota group-6 archaeon AD8-1]|nr:MAG: translation-associated GTPase [miscellaneous Crenarchaeota group-6 archaeon AD8-1]
MPKSYSRLLGIVGKPNTGKSTFFSSATLAPVDIANYPFTTIKSNHGIGYVRTPCVHSTFKVIDNPRNSLCINNSRLIPVSLIDIAGIVPGAWEGKGLGNKFLDEIRRADALINVVDLSGCTDSEGHLCAPGENDPIEDIKFLEKEINLWILSIIKKDWSKISRISEVESKDLYDLLADRLSGLAISRNHIINAISSSGLNPKKSTKWTDDNLLTLVDSLRKLSKPMLIAANKIDLPQSKKNLERLYELNYKVVPCSSEAELVLRKAAEKKLIDYTPGDSDFKVVNRSNLTQNQFNALKLIRKKVLNKYGYTGVQEALNKAYFEILKMIIVYPVEDLEHFSDHEGRVFPDAYLIPYGTTARQFAYLIHTELGENFLYAISAKTKLRLGEDAILKDQDVISIISTKKRG